MSEEITPHPRIDQEPVEATEIDAVLAEWNSWSDSLGELETLQQKLATDALSAEKEIDDFVADITLKSGIQIVGESPHDKLSRAEEIIRERAADAERRIAEKRAA